MRIDEYASNNSQINAILRELEAKKRDYELDGVELTEEDAQTVINFMNSDNMSQEEAIQATLSGISDCLSQE
jgi:hypothetical protein